MPVEFPIGEEPDMLTMTVKVPANLFKRKRCNTDPYQATVDRYVRDLLQGTPEEKVALSVQLAWQWAPCWEAVLEAYKEEATKRARRGRDLERRARALFGEDGRAASADDDDDDGEPDEDNDEQGDAPPTARQSRGLPR